MKQRIISGVILLAILLYVVIYAPFFVFYGFFSLVALISIWEYRRLIYSAKAVATDKVKKYWHILLLSIIGLATIAPFLMILSAYLNPNVATISSFQIFAERFLFYSVFFWFISLIIYRKTESLAEIVSPVLTAAQIAFFNGGFFFAIFTIRYLDPISYQLNFQQSPLLFLYVIILIVAADSGAYFVGRTLGKNKLAPKISPNKTIEGMLGGLASAAIFAILFLYFGDFAGATDFNTRLAFVVISMVTVAFSIHGDLLESFLKRRADIKDSSNLIPGHGGVLDRIDSLQAAFAIMTYFWFFIVLDLIYHTAR